MDFIMVEAYSPYMAILARSWLHALGAVSSALHVKLKYPPEGGVGELLGVPSSSQVVYGGSNQAPSL